MSAPSGTLWRGSRWRESVWTRARAVMAMGMVFGLGSAGTMAKWSQTVTAETGLFTTGAINLTINDQPSTISLPSAINLARGASTAGVINLQNKGDIDLSYTMDLAVAEVTAQQGSAGFEHGSAASLRQNMTLEIVRGGSVSGSTCSGGARAAFLAPPVSGTGVLAVPSLKGNSTDSYCVQVAVKADAPRQSRMAQLGYTFIFNTSIA